MLFGEQIHTVTIHDIIYIDSQMTSLKTLIVSRYLNKGANKYCIYQLESI